MPRLALVFFGVVALMFCFQGSATSSEGTGSWRLFKHGDARRYGEVLLPLRDGRLLVTSGGDIGSRTLVAMTEIFDPRSGNWTKAADIPVPGTQQSAAQLSDGSVLIAGGTGAPRDFRSAPPVLADTELFSPSTLTWITVGKLSHARSAAAMVALVNGGAMILGGSGASTEPSVEVFDLATKAWKPAANLITARSSARAVVIRDDTILVMGGYGPIPPEEVAILQPLYEETGRSVNQGPILTSELYDPASGQWRSYGMIFPKQLGQMIVTSAFQLPDGRVVGLVTGLLAAAGFGLQSDVPNTIYPFVLDPSTAAVVVGPAGPQGSPLAANGVLPDGRLVLTTVQRTLFYDPSRASWSVATASPLTSGLPNSGTAVLASGLVLVTSADQWAVLDPNGSPSHGSTALTLNSPILSWWLTITAIGLALIVAMQFVASRTGSWRSARTHH